MANAPALFGKISAAFSRGPTLGEKMATAQGRASGFDYLRLALALLILLVHSITQQIPPAPIADFTMHGPGSALRTVLVPMFFGLGGFLVAGSLDRTRSLITFLGLRALRIFPALWADILFSALLLGPLVTTVPLGEYFSAHEFKVYLLNLLGDIHYTLPGVFKHNPKPYVNNQLWTVPWDLGGYIALSIFTLFGFYAKRRVFLALAFLSQLAMPAAWVAYEHYSHHRPASYALVVVPCFLIGAAFHLYRDRIRWNGTWFALSLGVIAVVQFIHPYALLALPFPILYVTVFLGLCNPRRIWIITSGDYSYGTFLYHRQIQQAIWLFVPFAQTWYGNFLLSLPLSLAMAYLSWHGIEKFALSRRHRLNAVDARLAASAPFAMVAAVNSPPRGR
jgi:peptidoglycan/LPS O-acetylase OafA/YrhL